MKYLTAWVLVNIFQQKPQGLWFQGSVSFSSFAIEIWHLRLAQALKSCFCGAACRCVQTQVFWLFFYCSGRPCSVGSSSAVVVVYGDTKGWIQPT